MRVRVYVCVPRYTLVEKFSGGGGLTFSFLCHQPLSLVIGGLQASLHGYLDRILLNVGTFKVCLLTVHQGLGD